MNNIILIGFMGCGKSSIGFRLAKCLQRNFADTDQEIEKRERKTIAEIFADEGETHFRKLETGMLKDFLEKKEDGVISVGGGLPLLEENRRLLRELGYVVYLRATVETVYLRLKDDTTRPLLQGSHPQEKIKGLMEKRSFFYQEAADDTIDTDEKTKEEIVEEIREAVKKYENTGNERTQS